MLLQQFSILLVVLLHITPLAIAANQSDTFLLKLHGRQFTQAEVILRNATDVNEIYKIACHILEFSKNATLAENLMWQKLNQFHHEWYRKLQLPQLLEIMKIVMAQQSWGRDFPKPLELAVMERCGENFQVIMMQKDYEELRKLDASLSLLPMEIVQRIAKFSISKVMALILPLKILKRLDLSARDVNYFKALLFIEFYKKLRSQGSRNPNMQYKLAFGLQKLLQNPGLANNLHIKTQLKNLKHSLPPSVYILVFSSYFCLRSQETYHYLLQIPSSASSNTLVNQLNSSLLWQSHLAGHENIILENSFAQQTIFVNYRNSLDNPQLSEYHLKPLMANGDPTICYLLENVISRQYLCSRAQNHVVWQSGFQSNAAGRATPSPSCCWQLNNCSGLRRFLLNEI